MWAAKSAVVQGHVVSHPASDVFTSVLTVEESLVGWLTALRRAKSNDQRAEIYDRMAASARAMSQLQIVSCSRDALHRYDVLIRQHLNVGGYDLRIAAIALEAGAIVVTHNLSDFRRVPGLICEDWSV